MYQNQKDERPPNSRHRGRFLVQQLGGRVFVFETLQTHTRMSRSVLPLQNEHNGTCLLGVACNPLDWSPRIPIDVLQKSLILGVIKQALF